MLNNILEYLKLTKLCLIKSHELGKILNYNTINELFTLILNVLQSEDINYLVKLEASSILFESFELTNYFHSEEVNKNF